MQNDNDKLIWRVFIKRMLILSILVANIEIPLFAQAPDIPEYNPVEIQDKLSASKVVANRLLSEMGVTRSEIDTLFLRESITNSMAEILSQKTSIFIKSYGRGSIATASFRGTSPSHTQVTWNGMKLNSPMLGQVDFSLIPSYFIDRATVYHGAGSMTVSGGGLGGAVVLKTGKTQDKDGLSAQFIQGFGSYRTFNDFLKVSYSNGIFKSVTRLYFVDSENDFNYNNYNKKNIDGTYPVEKNKNGSYTDKHFLQEFYYNTKSGNKLSLSVWGYDSHRGVPMLNVNYRDEDESKNIQDESTIRVVTRWTKTVDKGFGQMNLSANVGFTGSDMHYKYYGENGTNTLVEMINTQSVVNSGYGQFGAELFISDKWSFTANVTGYYHSVASRSIYENTEYAKARPEISAFLSAKYRPWDRFGITLNMREEMYGNDFSPYMPAAYFDFIIFPKYDIVLKASVARNYRYPTLNDLYFLPGGNPDLLPESGVTYDTGLEFDFSRLFAGYDSGSKIKFSGEISAYNSNVENWILWLPTFRGYWEPHNVKKVHSYGIETKGTFSIPVGKVNITLDGNWTWTRSINLGNAVNWADESISKQLVYVPEYSSGVTGRLTWRDWSFIYLWNYFSERYTTSSNEKASKLYTLEAYYMSDITLERVLRLTHGTLSVKGIIYNLFNEEYVSVLSRPMPRMNFGIFVSYGF